MSEPLASTPSEPIAKDHPTAAEVIALLSLAPHPEGGFYRETFRDPRQDEHGRAASTLIYFLLPAGVESAWHRVDAVETWHFYAGAPLQLSLYSGEGSPVTHLLGLDLMKGERPQCVVPASHWQSAKSLGDNSRAAWTLVGCGVAPGFTFAGFELAPAGWAPPSNDMCVS